jgi:release factor glutamine methyltransferase
MPCAPPSEPNTSRPEVAGAPTLGEVLDHGTRQLATAKVREPRRQAAAIWAWLENTTVGEVWLRRIGPAEESAVERFRAAIQRRAGGEPMPYVVGQAGFRTLSLAVDRRVLIPRPETEGLVDRVLAWARGTGRCRAVADIGTGSGCIALALAVEGPFERVVATDTSEEALAVARENLALIAPVVPVELRQGVLFEALADERFDAIVSNPPYVSASEFEALEDSVRLFEPRSALVSDGDGMMLTEALLAGAGAYLATGGLLALEVDAARAERAAQVALELGWSEVRIEHDLFGRPRYLLANRE